MSVTNEGMRGFNITDISYLPRLLVTISGSLCTEFVTSRFGPSLLVAARENMMLKIPQV